MLILFDIDGTLLLTRGAGIAAMQDAAREIFHPEFTFEGIESAGRLDPLIYADAALKNGILDHAVHHDRFRAGYLRHLTRRFSESDRAEALPGVAALIDELRERDDLTLGLLTGNYAETGRLKIDRAGVDPDDFIIAAWGIDGAHRRDLPAVAAARYRERFGRAIVYEEVIIIGDTPHDIDCARHHGCRSIGVATGAFDCDTLRGHGADVVFADLSDGDAVLSCLVNGAASRRTI